VGDVNLSWVDYFTNFSLRVGSMIVIDLIREKRRSDALALVLQEQEEEQEIERQAWEEAYRVADSYYVAINLNSLRLRLKEGEDFIDSCCDESYLIAHKGWTW